jgi:hypothetical protein
MLTPTLAMLAVAMDRDRPADRLKRAVAVVTQFCEEFLVAPAREPGAQRLGECVIEMENRRGGKMRVELNGEGLANLAGLCSAFWSAA